ncbi:hypothetical protein [Phocaeicola plebeius]
MTEIEIQNLKAEIRRLKVLLDEQELKIRALSYYYGWASTMLGHIREDFDIDWESLSFHHDKYSAVINGMFHSEEEKIQDEDIEDDILELFYKL